MRRPGLGTLLAGLAVALVLPAASQGNGILERDSAGIRIVSHPAGFEATLPVWRLVEPAITDVGGGEGPGQELHLVTGAARFADGRIVVANRGSAELRFYDALGGYLRSLGRKGSGPGEFQSLSSLQHLAGDTLVIFDPALARMSYVAAGGAFAGSIQLQSRRTDSSYLVPMSRLGDGSILASQHRIRLETETSGPARRIPYALVRYRPSAQSIDTLAVVPGPEVYPILLHEGEASGPAFDHVRFGLDTYLAVSGTRLLIGTNESRGIAEYEGARLLRLIRTATPREPVTAADRDRSMQEAVARLGQNRQVSEAIRAQWRDRETTARYAERYPWHDRLLIGSDGSLWAERTRHYEDEGRRYVVYDRNGRAIARVQCPDRMRPFEVGPDHVIGLWRDGDDVQHVRVYRVTR